MTDRIVLRGLRGRGYHGVLEQERRTGQMFTADVALSLDTAAAAASDDLADTVDYGGLAVSLVDVIEGEPVALLETLAQRLADVCLVDPRVTAAEVTVRKPEAPIPVPFADVSVTIVRARG